MAVSADGIHKGRCEIGHLLLTAAVEVDESGRLSEHRVHRAWQFSRVSAGSHLLDAAGAGAGGGTPWKLGEMYAYSRV